MAQVTEETPQGDINVKQAHPAVDIALRVVKAGRYQQMLEMQGIPKTVWSVALGSDIWLPQDRQNVRQVFDSLLFGTLDVLGLPRVELPAEYIAAFVCIFADPVNWQTACTWYQNANTIDALVVPEDQMEAGIFEANMSAKRLFAMVCRFASVSDPLSLSAVRSELAKKMALPPSVDDLA